MHFYSIHVIAEYNLSGSEIICRQIDMVLKLESERKTFETYLGRYLVHRSQYRDL